MADNGFEKFLKTIFIIALIAFIFKNQSLEIFETIKFLLVENILLVIIIGVIILLIKNQEVKW